MVKGAVIAVILHKSFIRNRDNAFFAPFPGDHDIGIFFLRYDVFQLYVAELVKAHPCRKKEEDNRTVTYAGFCSGRLFQQKNHLFLIQPVMLLRVGFFMLDLRRF